MTLDLNEYDVQEINYLESKEIEGGKNWIAIACSVAASVIYDFTNGMYDEYKSRGGMHGAGGSY